MWIENILDFISVYDKDSMITIPNNAFVELENTENADDYDGVLGVFDVYDNVLIDKDIKSLETEYGKVIQSVWQRIVFAPYIGEKIELGLYQLDKNDPVENLIVHALIEEKDFNEMIAKQILYLSVNQTTIAVFHPKLKCFVPSGVTVKETEVYQGLMSQNNECVMRMIVYLGNMIKAHPQVESKEIYDYLAKIEALRNEIEASYLRAISIDDTEVFSEEKALVISDDVQRYIESISSDINIAGLAGYFGKRNEDIFVDEPVLIFTDIDGGSDVSGIEGVQKIYDNMYLLHPVKQQITNYSYEIVNDENCQFVIASVEKNHVKYRRIYSGIEDWKYSRPDWIIDLNYHLNETDLNIFTYASVNSYVSACEGREEIKLSFDIHECDNDARVATICSGTDVDKKWDIYQLHRPLNIITFYDDLHVCRGMLFVPRAIRKEKATNLLISLDPGGESSTLMIYDFSLKAHGAKYHNIAYPLIPMPALAFKKFVEMALDENDMDGQIRRESRLQKHTLLHGETLSNHWLYRINPTTEELFRQMVKYPSEGDKLFERMNIKTNLKMPLAMGDAPEENRKDYAMYVATVLRPILFDALREGYTLNQNKRVGSIKVLVAFPDNGQEDQKTIVFIESLRESFRYLNELLSRENQFVENRNYFLMSEANATAEFQIMIDSDHLTEGATVLVADIGATTTDLDLRIKNKNFTMSIPYAGDEITIRSMLTIFSVDEEISLINNSFTKQDIAQKIGKPIYQSLHENKTNKAKRENEGVRLALAYAFEKSGFDVSFHPDKYQKLFRYCTGQRILTLVPYISRIISFALKQNLIETDEDIIIISAGNGSKAFDNTYKNREEYFSEFIEKIGAIVKEKTGVEGIEKRIKPHRSNDKDKRSVAMGMIIMMQKNSRDKMQTINVSEKESEYVKRKQGIMQNDAFNEVINEYLRRFDIIWKKHMTNVFSVGKRGIKKGTDTTWNKMLQELMQNAETRKTIMNIIRDRYKNLVMNDTDVAEYAMTLSSVNELIDLVVKNEKNLSI